MKNFFHNDRNSRSNVRAKKIAHCNSIEDESNNLKVMQYPQTDLLANTVIKCQRLNECRVKLCSQYTSRSFWS